MNINKNEIKSLGEETRSVNSLNLLVTAFIFGMSIYVVSQLIGLLLTTEEFGPIIEGGNVSKLLLTDLMFLSLSLSYHCSDQRKANSIWIK